MSEILNDILNSFCQETVLIIAIFLGFILNFFLREKFFKYSKFFASTSVILALISSLKIQIIPTYYAFNGAFVSNFYTVFFKILTLLCSLIILLNSRNIILRNRTKIFDNCNLILLSTLGAITLIGANDFLTMFISLSLLGISIFILMLFSKKPEGKKISLKYFINYVVSSCVMLLGISYIYMTTGSFNFDVIYSVINKEVELSPFFDLGCILCSLGLTFYICVIPFSNWITDTFKNNKNTFLLFSLIPFLAGFCIISRLIVFLFQYTPILQALLFIIGILSIFKGVLGLLKQDNLYNFMEYSHNTQAGFILLGLCIANPYAVSTSLFYILIYIISVTGMYLCLKIMLIEERIQTISEIKGLSCKNKPIALTLVTFLFSLAGLPVTAGFLAKIYLFEAIIKCTNLYLAFLGIIMIATIIGIYAYIKPLKEICDFAEKTNISNTKFDLQKLTLYIMTILIIAICIQPDKLIQICQFISYQL